MKDILYQVSKSAIKLGDYDFKYDSSKWIGYPPASNEEISNLESRLKIKLPADFIEFIKTTNGFPATCEVEPSFLSISKIDYTKNITPNLIDNYVAEPELLDKYSRSIIIAGADEEQMFLLIPPKNENDSWEYWKFANWIPGEEPYTSLKDYFISVNNFINEELNTN